MYCIGKEPAMSKTLYLVQSPFSATEQQDAENIAAIHSSNLETISYARFAELCLSHSRCISLK